MDKTRFMVQSSRSCFRRWKSAPRMFTIMAMMACFIAIYALPFAENARAQEEALQCTEIFIAMMNWRFTMLLLSSIIIVLFGDLPIIEPFTTNSLMHGTRRSWLTGQILYVVITSFVLSLLIFVVTLLLCFPNLNFQNEWSRPVKLLAKSGRIAISPERMKLMLSAFIVEKYTPWQAFAHSFFLFTLMGCFYGLVTLVLKFRFHSGGFLLLFIVNAFSWSVSLFVPERVEFAILSLLSPHYHASLDLHRYCAVNPVLPSMCMSYLLLIGSAVFLIAYAMVLVKHYDFVLAQEGRS